MKFSMRARRIVAGVIVVCLIALITMLLWPERTKLDPPAVSVVRIENAGVDDDEGKEMWLVTLRISNPNKAPFDPENSVYIKSSLSVEGGAYPIEVRVTNRRVAITGKLGCRISPGDKHEIAWVVPAGADACRASLKYTHGVMRDGALTGLARRLPRGLRRRLP
jgi:hypothetical protein